MSQNRVNDPELASSLPDEHESVGEVPLDEKTQAATTFPEGGTRAWAVALGASASIFCTFGFANSFGVFQEYYSTHQLAHLSESTISWIGSIQLFCLFAGGLLGGPLFDLYGERIFWPSAVLYLLGVFMTSLCKEYWQFILAQAICTGAGMGLTLSPCMAATSQYFNKKRGAAIGLAIAGSSAGGVVFPISLSRMLYNTNLSFGWSVRVCAFIMVALLIPASFAIKARLPPRKGLFFLFEAFKNKTYVTLIAAVFMAMLSAFVPLFYLPSFGVMHGITPTLASYLLAILNAASFFGRVICGINADKIGAFNMLTLASLVTAILLFAWPHMTSTAAIVVFSVLFGFSSGSLISLVTVAYSRIPENPAHIGTYMGMGMLFQGVAALVSAPMNGAVLAHGGYNDVSYLCGSFALVATLLVVLAKFFLGKGMLSLN